MKNTIPFFFVVIIILSACSTGPKDLSEFMVDASEFKINDTVLKDGEEVEILGSSGNLTKEHKIDFYNLVVVRSLETGDTVNVLVTSFFQADLNDPKTKFLSNSSIMGKIMENSDDLNKLDNVKDIKAKKYSKVFYDAEYIQVDVRNYPAIAGSLGDFTIEGDLNLE